MPDDIYDEEEEIWKDVEGFPGYKVSSYGNVKSYRQSRRPGHFLQPRNTFRYNGGYTSVDLCDGKEKHEIKVHILVAKAFLGQKPTDKHQLHHIDSNKRNNHYKNLEWVTVSQNLTHAVRTGLRSRGGYCKPRLNVEQVREIRNLIKTKNHTQEGLASMFSVSRGCIRGIISGKNWPGV